MHLGVTKAKLPRASQQREEKEEEKNEGKDSTKKRTTGSKRKKGEAIESLEILPICILKE